MVNTEVRDPLIDLADKPNAKQKVFDYMVRNMQKWNKIVLMQAVVSKELGMTRQHMNRVLKQLQEKRLIALNGKVQNNNVYMVDPSIKWVGNADDHKKGLEKYAALMHTELVDKSTWEIK